MPTLFPELRTSQVPAPASQEPVESAPTEFQAESIVQEGEMEWVVGSRQLGALVFVGIAGIALFSGISYLAGKASVTRAATPPTIQVQQPAPAPTPVTASAVNSSIGDQFAASAVTPQTKSVQGLMFYEPTPGQNYLQMAAVEKPIAAVFAEGLRSHGLTAFVASGPTPNIYRVLIGPLSDISAYTGAKVELDKIGLTTFMRKYEKESALPVHPLP